RQSKTKGGGKVCRGRTKPTGPHRPDQARVAAERVATRSIPLRLRYGWQSQGRALLPLIRRRGTAASSIGFRRFFLTASAGGLTGRGVARQRLAGLPLEFSSVRRRGIPPGLSSSGVLPAAPTQGG